MRLALSGVVTSAHGARRCWRARSDDVVSPVRSGEARHGLVMTDGAFVGDLDSADAFDGSFDGNGALDGAFGLQRDSRRDSLADG
jgi:hypothetical protein